MHSDNKWLYPSCLLAPDFGVSYELRYLGAILIRVSIKSVDLGTRTKIAHAAIHRVIENIGLRPPDSFHVDKSISSYLAVISQKYLTAVSVCLTVTSSSLTVKSLETKRILFQHDLSVVSFASGGDPSAADFVCFVAKTPNGERTCYVFECPRGQAQDVIITLGQAFQLGFQEFKRIRTFISGSVPSSNGTSSIINPVTFSESLSSHRSSLISHRRIASPPVDQHDRSSGDLSPLLSFDKTTDFTESTWLLNDSDHQHSCQPQKAIALASVQPASSANCDSIAEPDHVGPVETNCTYQDATSQKVEQFRRLEPIGEPWYVGPMSRSDAERLLRYEGDFLVRASQHQLGQFVLSGLQENKCRHLLLADPNGQVRTRERVFDSIQHLIDHHVQNGLPIRSADSEIRLIFPVSTNSLYEA